MGSLHPFLVSVDDLGQAAVVRVQGEVDTATAPYMGEAVNGLLAEQRRVVLDLAGVEFMDLHGLAVLLRAARRGNGDGASFALSRPAPCVLRLLELVHATGELTILPDGSEPLDAA